MMATCTIGDNFSLRYLIYILWFGWRWVDTAQGSHCMHFVSDSILFEFPVARRISFAICYVVLLAAFSSSPLLFCSLTLVSIIIFCMDSYPICNKIVWLYSCSCLSQLSAASYYWWLVEVFVAILAQFKSVTLYNFQIQKFWPLLII